MGVIRVERVGNDLILIYDRGERVLSYRQVGGLWLPTRVPEGGNTDPEEPPPDPDPGGDSDFAWPFRFPTDVFNIGVNGFETPARPTHRALDFGTGWAVNNAVVKSMAAGRVTFAGWHNAGGGWRVEVNHGSHNGKTYSSTYNHMIASPPVSVGQNVNKGTRLGNVGSTGNSTGPHLHFEVWNLTDPPGAHNSGGNNGWDRRMNPVVFMNQFNPSNEHLPRG